MIDRGGKGGGNFSTNSIALSLKMWKRARIKGTKKKKEKKKKNGNKKRITRATYECRVTNTRLGSRSTNLKRSTPRY